jgi:carboxyl-terminal processing protease
MQHLLMNLLLLLLPLDPDAREPGQVFNQVVQVLENRFYDSDFREEYLPGMAEQFRPLAERTATLKEEREVIHSFLSGIPVSHLALLSSNTYEDMFSEIKGKRTPRFGFQLVEAEGNYFAHSVLGGGPADEAGLLRWDCIRAVDGVPTTESRRLDWRSDDAYLADPPLHYLHCEKGDQIDLLVERTPGKTLELQITARSFFSYESEGTQARVLPWKGKEYGYIHFWYIINHALPELLEKRCTHEFADCQGLVLDLRGRGGSGDEVKKLIKVLQKKWHPRPLVVLVDHGTRSAKEILAFEIRQAGLGLIVGETTAGAVIPASFAEVGGDSVLMFPSFTLGRHTDLLEGVGVKPDIPTEDAGPFSEGADPILKAGLETLHRGIVKL